MTKPIVPSKACSWIEGDPRHGAKPCGEQPVAGKPYCNPHLKRAYAPQSFRKSVGAFGRAR